MASFEDEWLAMVAKRPLLATPNAVVTITAEQLKSLVRQFFERGERAANGGKVGGTLEDLFPWMK